MLHREGYHFMASAYEEGEKKMPLWVLVSSVSIMLPFHYLLLGLGFYRKHKSSTEACNCKDAQLSRKFKEIRELDEKGVPREEMIEALKEI